MRRRFLENISLLLILNIIIKAFWVLGIDRTVQNVVGAGEYGFYFSLFSFSVLFNIVLDFGITNYNNRRVSQDPGQLSLLLGNLFIIRIGFAVAYMVISLSVAFAMGYDLRQTGILTILLINQFLASFILYLRSNITALQLFRTDALLSVTDRLIMIVTVGLLLFGGVAGSSFRIEWFVWCQTFGYVVTFAIALLVVLGKRGGAPVIFNRPAIVIILRESAPYALLSLFMAVYWRVDSVMLERMLPDGKVAAGVYAQAFRLLDAASMIPYLFAVILLPQFTRAMALGEDTVPLEKMALVMLALPAAAVTLVSVLFSKEIMALLYIEHVGQSARLFAILMISYVPVAVTYIFSTVLTARGTLAQLNIIAGSGMIINVLLNVFLIPSAGAEGAATASVITQTAMAALFAFVVIRGRKKTYF
ncbi:MAG: oligosaccharide flippase family protein [Bacteroidales bacterium]|nr:oligosaccharide flippase family protein [Bacteroidales bacterium]